MSFYGIFCGGLSHFYFLHPPCDHCQCDLYFDYGNNFHFIWFLILVVEFLVIILFGSVFILVRRDIRTLECFQCSKSRNGKKERTKVFFPPWLNEHKKYRYDLVFFSSQHLPCLLSFSLIFVSLLKHVFYDISDQVWIWNFTNVLYPAESLWLWGYWNC